MKLKNDIEPSVEDLEEYSEILGVGKSGEPVEVLVTNLRKYFDEQLEGADPDEEIICSICGERTNDDDLIDVCPFCGDDGGELEDDEDEDELDEEGSEIEIEEPKVVILEEVEDVSEVVDKALKKVAKKRSNHDKEESIVVIDNAVSVIMKDELEREKEVIRRERTNMMASGYDLGVSLKTIYDRELWRADCVTSWREFCKSVDVGYQMAYSLMKLVEEFDRETFLSVGIAKLRLIMRSSDEDKPKLLSDAQNGMSLRELRDSVSTQSEREVLKAEPSVNREAPIRQERDPDELPPANGETVTLLTRVDGKKSTFPFRHRETHEEMEEWSPEAYAEIPISQDVVQYIVLKTDKVGRPIAVTVAFRSVSLPK